MNDPATPCVKVCTLDAEGKLCLGCGRTADEIATWARLDAAARRDILSRLPARLEALVSGAKPTSR